MCTLDSAINRQVAHENDACALAQALRQQPQIDVKDKRMSIIGHGSFGDVNVDLYGVIDCGELDLWDVAIAGTRVSLSSVVTSKQWDDLQQYAQDAYDRDRSPKRVAA